MNEGFVKEIEDKLRKPMVLRIGEGDASEPVAVVPPGWTRLPADIPAPVFLEVGTLAGVRDYLARNVDGLDKTKLVLHVSAPENVWVLGALEGEDVRFRRQCVMRALAPIPHFRFGEYMPAEDFIVGLQSCFVKTMDRDELLAKVSAISESSVRESRDDGFAQEVKVSKGVMMSGSVPLPNPVLLAPYRTFIEVEQPASNFTLRARPAPSGADKPLLALFESDGGAWRLPAIEAVASWLREAIKDVAVIG